MNTINQQPPRTAILCTGSDTSVTTPGKMRPKSKCASAVLLVLTGATLASFAPRIASAQNVDPISNPPLAPMDVTVFPMRDFTSIEGFEKNADVLIQARRSGVISDAVGRTDATGFIEVNHPGGLCWRNVTPDIVAGDTIRVTYRDTSNNRTVFPTLIGTGAATTTQNVLADHAIFGDNNTIVVKGTALLPSGARIPLNRLEVRIVNPEFIASLPLLPTDSRIRKRDIRAVSNPGPAPLIPGFPETSATLAYDGTTANFIAVFSGLNLEEQQLAYSGQTRVMAWQQTNAAGDRLGMTIYEADEVGGPGMGGCPPGPGVPIVAKAPDQPLHYTPTTLLDASVRANQPSLKDVIVFPDRDFISIDGYLPGTKLQVVVRRGTIEAPLIVGSAIGTVGKGGIFEVNHPGGACWTGQTPNIVGGDYVDVMPISGTSVLPGQTQRVIDTGVKKSATIGSDGLVRVTGITVDPRPNALDFMEQRIINPDFTDTRIGRRDIRADTNGGRVQNVPGGSGDLKATGTLNEWRAVYTGLTAAEQELARLGQSRAMAWHTTNGNGDRFGLTISEFGEVGGPGMGGCPPTGDKTTTIK